MDTEQNQVADFMRKAGQDTPYAPVYPSLEIRKLRVALIAEELLELAEAFNLNLEIVDDSKGLGTPSVHIVEKAGPPAPDALCQAYDATLDLHVVTVGTNVAMGTRIDPGFREVHRSNMSKFIDGHRRADGKWVKGPSYSPACLQPIIDDLRRQVDA